MLPRIYILSTCFFTSNRKEKLRKQPKIERNLSSASGTNIDSSCSASLTIYCGGQTLLNTGFSLFMTNWWIAPLDHHLLFCWTWELVTHWAPLAPSFPEHHINTIQLAAHISYLRLWWWRVSYLCLGLLEDNALANPRAYMVGNVSNFMRKEKQHHKYKEREMGPGSVGWKWVALSKDECFDTSSYLGVEWTEQCQSYIGIAGIA